MLATRLVHLIEANSDRLAAGLMETFQTSPRCAELSRVPREELADRAREVYRNLGDWLLGTTEAELERTYRAIGARRAAQGVPLPQLLWALIATKERLFDFLQREGVVESSVELIGELELLRQLERFFDRAMYHAAVGHESGRQARAA
jgi:hypothetical protein